MVCCRYIIVNTLHKGGDDDDDDDYGGSGGDISAEQKKINGHQSFLTLWGTQNIVHSLKCVDKAIKRMN